MPKPALALPVLIAIVNVLVVLCVGVALFAGLLSNREVSQRILDQQVRDACGQAAFKVYPDALANPASLQKATVYSKACARLNGIKDRPVLKLPTVP